MLSRINIRTPDMNGLMVVNSICNEHLSADVIALLGSVDFVLGSVDRIDSWITIHIHYSY